jgi:hypothetical protein
VNGEIPQLGYNFGDLRLESLVLKRDD